MNLKERKLRSDYTIGLQPLPTGLSPSGWITTGDLPNDSGMMLESLGQGNGEKLIHQEL